jgi:hypothetical protein
MANENMMRFNAPLYSEKGKAKGRTGWLDLYGMTKGGSGLAGAVATGPSTQETAQPASPTASASDLQNIMSRIPIADDGDIIRSEHFNLMRAALFELAGRMGISAIDNSLTLTLLPAFRAINGANAWTADYGMARSPGNETVKGWMAVDLPDGGTLDEMKVFGRTSAAGNDAVKVILRRRLITDPTKVVDLITVNINARSDPKVGEAAPVRVNVSGSTEFATFTRIDSRIYNYFLIAEATLAAAETVELTAIQIVSRFSAD